MRSEMDRLATKHKSVKERRCVGLFGLMEIRKNGNDEPIAPYNGTHPAMQKLAKFFDAEGLCTMIRWDNFMCNPPLCITEAELRGAFEIIDGGLEITDEVYEG